MPRTGFRQALAVGVTVLALVALATLASVAARPMAAWISTLSIPGSKLPAGWLLPFLVFFGVLGGVFSAAACLLRLTPFGRLREVYRRPYPEIQRRTERRSAPVILLFDAVAVVVIVLSGTLRYDLDASGGAILGTIAALYLWFEVWFYVTHRLMHTRALWFMHKRHHVSAVPHPLTALSFSLSERAIYHLGIFLGALGVSLVRPLPVVGMLAFLGVTYLFNALVHCNFEIVPAWVVRSPMGRVLGSPSFHAMHHARGANHYSFTSSFLDYAFGTVWPDYQHVHARAVSGDGLRALNERDEDLARAAASRS